MQCLQAAKPYQPAALVSAHCKGILNACYMVTPANLISTDEIAFQALLEFLCCLTAATK